MFPISQGDIFLVNLNPIKGHEQAGIRPALILQNNILNQHLNTVLIAPLTSNLRAKDYLFTHFLPKKMTGLNKDSVVLLPHMRALDKSRLTKKLGSLSPDDFFDLRVKFMNMFW